MADKLDAALAAYEKTNRITNDAELEEALREIASREIAKADGDVELVDLAAAELLILSGDDPDRVRLEADGTADARLSSVMTRTGAKDGKKSVRVRIGLLAAALVAVVVTLAVVAGANSTWDLFADKSAEYGKNVSGLFGTSLAAANDEQRARLEALFEEYGQDAGWHEREIRIIMGELPEDTPRLTREKAIEICSDYDLKNNTSDYSAFLSDIVRLFNQVAGAPDINGGSGQTVILYYTDDSENYAISVSEISVRFFDLTTGTNEKLLKYSD